MNTVKNLRVLAADYEIKGRSKLRKHGLQQAISGAHTRDIFMRLKRAAHKPLKFPALFGDPFNPNKKVQRRKEIQNILYPEADALLAERRYRARIKKNPNIRLEAQRRLAYLQARHPPKEPLARRIAREGKRILQEGGTLDGADERGRRYILLKFFRGLNEDLTGNMMQRLEQELQT